MIQECKIIVDEDGTKAAAVTTAIAKSTAMIPQKENVHKEVHLNRPFAYMIVDNQSGQVLFMGKVVSLKD